MGSCNYKCSCKTEAEGLEWARVRGMTPEAIGLSEQGRDPETRDS